MTTVHYPLERLFEDQHPDLVTDTIPSLLTWLSGKQSAAPPVSFRVRVGREQEEHHLHVDWAHAALEARCVELRDRLRRLRVGPQREHFVELAAYGLALVAISVWMPGRRAAKFNEGAAPDILLGPTDGAVRGVEVAGRSSGGFGALRTVIEGTAREPGKRANLMRSDDVAEAHLSLWCLKPKVSVLLQVKP